MQQQEICYGCRGPLQFYAPGPTSKHHGGEFLVCPQSYNQRGPECRKTWVVIKPSYNQQNNQQTQRSNPYPIRNNGPQQHYQPQAQYQPPPPQPYQPPPQQYQPPAQPQGQLPPYQPDDYSAYTPQETPAPRQQHQQEPDRVTHLEQDVKKLTVLLEDCIKQIETLKTLFEKPKIHQ